MTPHSQPLRQAVEADAPWHPGQSTFHPDTLVIYEVQPIPGDVAETWALIRCTWEGQRWWYGWCGFRVSEETMLIGWALVPRS